MENKFILSPSLLACDFGRITENIRILEKENVKYIHLDVMDGIFVPNISFGQPLIKSLRSQTSLVFDTHLMITAPERYIGSFAQAGADIITIHFESTFDPASALKMIKSYGKKAALAIKPNTSPEAVRSLIEYCDMILVMTVEPGFGGQKLIPKTLDSIAAVKRIADECGAKIDIQADGGIDPSNVKAVVDAGANVIVAGSSVLGKPDVAAAVRSFF